MDSSLVHNQLRAPAVIQCSSLAKQVIRRRPNQLTSAAASCTILESANDACGRARQLATNQAGCASQFISNCVNARTQLVTARIATPSVILQRLHSCHPDCNLGQSLAPRAPETISDDHRNRKVQTFFQITMNPGSRAVWIFRQQQSMTTTIKVGNIYTAVGANRAVCGFGDENTSFAANHAPALRHRQFRHACVELETPCPRAGSSRWPDLRQVHNLAFSLGNDLVFHHENITWDES